MAEDCWARRYYTQEEHGNHEAQEGYGHSRTKGEIFEHGKQISFTIEGLVLFPELIMGIYVWRLCIDLLTTDCRSCNWLDSEDPPLRKKSTIPPRYYLSWRTTSYTIWTAPQALLLLLIQIARQEAAHNPLQQNLLELKQWVPITLQGETRERNWRSPQAFQLNELTCQHTFNLQALSGRYQWIRSRGRVLRRCRGSCSRAVEIREGAGLLSKWPLGGDGPRKHHNENELFLVMHMVELEHELFVFNPSQLNDGCLESKRLFVLVPWQIC